MPAATTCCRARSTARYHANNAWAAANNPAGDGRYVTDATCPSLRRPAHDASSPAATRFAHGTYAGLWFFAPPDTAITNYQMIVPPLLVRAGQRRSGRDDVHGARLRRRPSSAATGQFDADHAAEPGRARATGTAIARRASSGAADTGVITRTLSDSTAAKTPAHRDVHDGVRRVLQHRGLHARRRRRNVVPRALRLARDDHRQHGARALRRPPPARGCWRRARARATSR